MREHVQKREGDPKPIFWKLSMNDNEEEIEREKPGEFQDILGIQQYHNVK